MVQSIENQNIAPIDACKRPSASETSKKLPMLFGKQDLCQYLDLFSPSGKANIRLLRRNVLTDEVCQRSGFSWQDYLKKSYFSFEHCQKIRCELKIE